MLIAMYVSDSIMNNEDVLLSRKHKDFSPGGLSHLHNTKSSLQLAVRMTRSEIMDCPTQSFSHS